MRRAAFVVVIGLTLSGCLGSITRAEFQAELESRGGGFEQALIIQAVEVVAGQLGAADYAIRQLVVTPSVGVVVVVARDPRRPDQLDRYTVRNGGLLGVDPVRVGQAEDLDRETFPVSDLALEGLNAMADVALEQYDTAGGHVSTVVVSLLASRENPEVGRPVVIMNLESPRSTAQATFAADGSLLAFDVR
ncbi:MAG TPA: hypothetical protein VMM13_17365 [Euzebya sp.]|nr:hypothetical protein [Euzebya sp.]